MDQKYFLQIHTDFSRFVTKTGCDLIFKAFIQHVNHSSAEKKPNTFGFRVHYDSEDQILWLFFSQASEDLALECRKKLEELKPCLLEDNFIQQGVNY